MLERLARHGARGTFFVLGEVARQIPATIRELAAAGHEVACHGELHLRANQRSPAAFRDDLLTAKARLEDLLGSAVVGFRAPEWSLRNAANPRFRIVAEVGFRYDSSLLPAVGAGDLANPTLPTLFVWSPDTRIVEIPPLTWGGRFRLPTGGWCGRPLSAEFLARVASVAASRGGLPTFVAHPWELVERPCPGLLTGFARWVHEAGRSGYAERFEGLVERLRFSQTLSERCAELTDMARQRAQLAAVATLTGFEILRPREAE